MTRTNESMERGKRILELRKSKGISRRGLAKNIDISDTALANIEKGDTTNITIKLGMGIAKALGISFNELFEIEAQESGEVKKLKSETEELRKRNKELEKMNALYEKYHIGFQKAIQNSYGSARVRTSADLFRTLSAIGLAKGWQDKILELFESFIYTFYDFLKGFGYIDEEIEAKDHKENYGWLDDLLDESQKK